MYAMYPAAVFALSHGKCVQEKTSSLQAKLTSLVCYSLLTIMASNLSYNPGFFQSSSVNSK